MLAIGAVTAVVLLLVGVFGQSADDLGSGGVSTIATVSPTTPPVVAAPTTAPATTTAPTPGTTATDGELVTADPTPILPTEFPVIQVAVLNSTAEAGLAGRVSDYLGSLGWSTGAVDNFDTPADVTTVYFPEPADGRSYEDAASALATVLPGSGATTAAAIPEVSTATLTVVLGQDAANWVLPGDG